MKKIVVKNLLNYDVPALCSIIEFSSDYSSEVVISSKLILDEKGYKSWKKEKQFSKFKSKNSITENEIQKLKEKLKDEISKKLKEKLKDESSKIYSDKENGKSNLNNEHKETYLEEAGLKLKLIGNMILYTVLLQVFSMLVYFINPKELLIISLPIGIIQIIFFLVILYGFFDAGNALIKYSKSKNSNN
tara:strand:+ start:116 stop:682 length:567 start_codon:yes stop_codon:yes gene_type:complete